MQQPRQTTLQRILLERFSNTKLNHILNGDAMKMPARNMVEEPEEYKGKDIDKILDPDAKISDFGLTAGLSINWESIDLPTKTNLAEHIHRRIYNYKNTDCVVQIDKDEIHCHLIVLKSFSSYFNNHNDKNVILIPSDKCSASDFIFIYEWMTFDDYIQNLTRDRVLNIFKAAQFFNIKDLLEQCWSFIDNELVFNEESAFKLYTEAKAKNLPQVCELMLPRIKDIFLLLVSSQDWVELSLEEVQIFLKSNYIYINSELEILMSAVRWLFHDWENRADHKIPIISCVRFGNFYTLQLIDITRNPINPEFIELFSDPDISDMVDEGLSVAIIKESGGEGKIEWQRVLNLEDPASRNFSGLDTNYRSYKEFLKFLRAYRKAHLLEKCSLSFKEIEDLNA